MTNLEFGLTILSFLLVAALIVVIRDLRFFIRTSKTTYELLSKSMASTKESNGNTQQAIELINKLSDSRDALKEEWYQRSKEFRDRLEDELKKSQKELTH